MIDALFDARRPRRSLEVGLALGASACLIADKYRAAGAAAARQHVVIDPFQATVWDDCGVLALERKDLDGYCAVKREFSSIALARLLGEGETFDLVYIDGSHLFEDVFLDVYFASRLLAPGGMVLLDDSSDPHLRKVVRFIRTNMSGGLREFDLAGYRPKTGVGARLRYAVGKALGRVQLTAFERAGEVARAWNAPFRNF